MAQLWGQGSPKSCQGSFQPGKSSSSLSPCQGRSQGHGPATASTSPGHAPQPCWEFPGDSGSHKRHFGETTGECAAAGAITKKPAAPGASATEQTLAGSSSPSGLLPFCSPQTLEHLGRCKAHSSNQVWPSLVGQNQLEIAFSAVTMHLKTHTRNLPALEIQLGYKNIPEARNR